jgi:hypothetical protein
MANEMLWQSAVICSVFHALFFSAIPGYDEWKMIVTIALATSVLNHGFTNDLLKWMDRTAVCMALAYDVYLCKDMPVCFHILLVCCFLYFFHYHVEAHVLVTLTHIQMLAILSSK